MARPVKLALRLLLWPVGLVFALWAFGALHFDLPRVGPVAAWGFVAVLALWVARARGAPWKLAGLFLLPLAVWCWWQTLRPSNDRDWQPDVARLARAEVRGDEITFHNVRNFDYRSETDFDAVWETRTVRLSALTGADLFINYWGSPWMAHPIVSFQFADGRPLAFSIETRKETGESYSAIGGIYRQYELIYLVADERDVIRVRTNIRKGETAYLYRTTLGPDAARGRLLEYVASINGLTDRPQWYNALDKNCTTAIRAQHPRAQRAPWDWRMLANGKMDALFYQRGAFQTAGLPFAALRAQALINEAARAADRDPEFPTRIRTGRAGF